MATNSYVNPMQEYQASQQFESQHPGQALQETNTSNLVATDPNSGVKSTQSIADALQASINQSQAQEAQLSDKTSAYLKSLVAEEAANAPGNPISIDTNAIQSQAKANAANTVNPLYTQYMNNYLQELNANNEAAKAQNELNIGTERTAEGNTLAQNQLAVNAAAATNAGTQGDRKSVV